SPVGPADVDTDPTGRALRGARAALGFAAGRDVGFVDEDGGVPAVPTPGHGHRLNPAAALQSSGEALGGVVQAHRSDSRHDQPPVPVRTDRGPLHVVVQAEAVAATALLLEPGCADAAAGAFADERFHPVLPRLVCVEERGLEGIGRHGTPPRADPLDSVAVVAFELIPALLDGGLGGDLDDAPGLLPRRLLGPPEGDELVDDE